MAIPKPSWDIATMVKGYDYKKNNAAIANIASAAVATSWPLGTVDADGLDKVVTTFLIWNNKGTTGQAGSDVSDMVNCRFTCVDANRGNTGAGNCLELLGGGTTATRWMSARNDIDLTTVGSAAFASIGSLAPATIDSGAIDAFAAGQATNKIIKGTANDGLFGTAATAANYALITAKVNIPAAASAGPVSGYLRLSFSYI